MYNYIKLFLNFFSEVERKDKTSHLRNIIVTTGTIPPTVYPNHRLTTPTKLFESNNPGHGENNASCEKEQRYEEHHVSTIGGHLGAGGMESIPGATELCPKHSAIVGAGANGLKVRWNCHIFYLFNA